jgi:predicted transcriptional regulator
MSGALEDIRFLSDSRHRAVAMATLAGGSRSRGELRDATGASSATVGRIAKDFEDRGWLARDGGEYALTTLGGFVARSFARLHEDMLAARDLNELLRFVPLERMGIEVERLTDARVTRESRENPFALVSRVREIELESDEAFSLTDFFPAVCIDGRHEGIVEGDQRFEAVFSPGVVEAAMESVSAGKFRELVDCDRTAIYVYDDEIAQPVMFHDGLACIIVRDEENVTVGLIETDDEAVVEWVRERFEAHRKLATPLSPADLERPLEEVLAGD